MAIQFKVGDLAVANKTDNATIFTVKSIDPKACFSGLAKLSYWVEGYGYVSGGHLACELLYKPTAKQLKVCKGQEKIN